MLNYERYKNVGPRQKHLPNPTNISLRRPDIRADFRAQAQAPLLQPYSLRHNNKKKAHPKKKTTEFICWKRTSDKALTNMTAAKVYVSF